MATKHTLEQFIEKANKIHNNKYLYDKTIYIDNKTPTIITCKIHTDVLQIPKHHIHDETGCPKCNKFASKTWNYVLKQSLKIHNNKYTYYKSTFTFMINKMKINCKNHGIFWQTPRHHIYDQHGCPKCSMSISKKETQWLNSLNIPKKYRNKLIKANGKSYQADAFDSDNNIIYEFLGDYWHGNPDVYPKGKNSHNKKTFKSLYKKTMKREEELIKLGYKVISIWENDFDKEVKGK